MNKYSFNRNADTNLENGGAAPIETPATETPAGKVSTSPIAEKAPESRQVIGTVADVSNAIVRNNREFRVITIVDENNKNVTYAVSEKFYLGNKARIAPDVAINLTIEKTIANVTTWTDRETGVVSHHTSTGDNVRNVVLATGSQAKIGMLNQLEDRLKGYAEQPALAGAMAQLYQAMLR